MAVKKKKKTTRKKRKLIMLGFELVLLVVLLAGLYIWNLVGKIDFEDFAAEDAGINSDLSNETLGAMKGHMNIAIFGVDNRESGNYNGGNADTIMIVSLNKQTKEAKIVSVYRDTLMNIGNGKYRKANAAYSAGGAKQAVQMLNSNLDLNITEYVCVDWKALIEGVDALGGVEIELTSGEVQQINEYYLLEIDEAFGITSNRIAQSSGRMTLDGAQALAYARIRKTAGDDFKRTSRQRIVIEAMLNKAKTSDVGTLLNICNAIFPDISTTLKLDEILGLAKDVKAYTISSTSGFPFRLTAANLETGDTVIPVELDNNVIELHEYLFGATDYVPSETMQMYSNDIVRISGIDESCENIVNTSEYNDTAGQSGTDFKNQE